MKIRNVIFIFLFLIIGCTNNKTKDNAEAIVFDSISYYLNSSKELNIKEKEKIKLLRKSFTLALKSNNNKENRDKLADITFDFYKLNLVIDFNYSSKKLLKDSKESNDSINLGKAYRCMAIYYKDAKILDTSFSYYLKAEKYYFKQKDQLILANILYNKGIVQCIARDFLGAEFSLSKAYTIFKDSNESLKIYGVLNQLGLVYNELEEYDKAFFFHSKALEIVRKNNLEFKNYEEAVSYNNIGYLFIKQKKFNYAITNFELGLNAKIIDKDPELYSLLIDNLAYSRLQISNNKDLPALFLESLNVRKKLKDLSLIILSYIHLSEYYYKKDKNDLAIEYANKALEIAKISEIPLDFISALQQASLVDKKNASKYSENYIRISDSLHIAERKSLDRFARIQLETDEIIQQKDILEEKNRNILNYFLGAIIIGGFLFFIRIQRSRSRELVLKQSQQQANEEIYRLIISHQNQLEEGRDLEKKRLSKELHDGVLGRLFGLRLNLDGLNNSDDENAKQQRLDYLNELQLIEQDLRDISHELNRENLVLINNFVAIINNLLEQQAKINPAKIKTIIADDIDWEIVSNTSKINLYRILQEALQNINKHAEAKTILVHFRKDKKGNLLFNIEDDGKGYDLNGKKSKGIGMKNIVSRTQQCNGIIDIKSEIGKGSKIIITFPLESKTIKV